MPRATKVIVASRLYSPEAGAAAYRLAAVVSALEATGYETEVLTTRPRDGTRSSGGVRRWPVLRDKTGAVRGYLQYASFDIPLFFRLLIVRRPGVVIVEPPPTTGVVCRIVCGIRRIPYLYFSADVLSRAAGGARVNPLVLRMLEVVEGWVLRGAAEILAVSDGVKSEVVELGATPEKVTVVGTGIDTEKFLRAGDSADVDYPFFVYAGTMSEVHGASVFVDAFVRIAEVNPTARLMMFGQGVEVAALKRTARTLGPGRIEFPGLVSGEEVARWLREATAGLASVRPDRGYDFAYATKAFASISCGSPVIYAGVGPVASLVENNDLGWAVRWDVDEVAAAMTQALGGHPSAATRERLSEWVVHNHSLIAVASRVVSVVDELASRRTT